MRRSRAWAFTVALAIGAAGAGACSLAGLKFDLEEEVGGTCAPGSAVACYSGPAGTEGVGICRAGAQTCSADGAPEGPCEGEQTPLAESCDAAEQDQDCDGEVNEEGADCSCGDGYLSVGEACDDGNQDETDLCTSACQPAVCGDGFVQPDLGESCDDGGTSDGDRCSPTCQQQEVLAIAAGSYHTCALLGGGSVKCWGGNGGGQLGLGHIANRGVGAGQMGDNLPSVDLGTGKTATAIAAGGSHTCARLNDYSVKCWGDNNDGQLGLGDAGNRGDNAAEMGDNLPSVDLGTGKTATAIAVGGEHTCALLNGGTVKCWGGSYYGQLGLGETADRGDQAAEMGDNLPPVDLGTGKTTTALVAGDRHTCALLNDGTVKCWGYNNFGELGLGDTEVRGDGPAEMGDNLPSVNLGAGRMVTALAAGSRHTCALLSDDTIKCWGNNNNGQLGLGDTVPHGDAAAEMGDNLPSVNLGTGRTATALSAGGLHTCAVLDDSSVKCWGRNDGGQLGLEDIVYRGGAAADMGDNLPSVSLGSGKTAVALALGYYHTCSRLDDDSLKCWGQNDIGQLGLGDTLSRGDASGEMGDALPTVKLFSDLW